ncbi:MAG: 16S rRNA (guanine(966)-N(2))-methyltransferase RsmD [Candidatus Rokuibacteriota bacterium]
MRILAGRFKGRRLVTPKGDVTRPTADQVRLALMDTLMPWLPQARVLDLFAGGGGGGLEALSRGAGHATFVERDARAVAALRANVDTLGVAAVTRVVRGEAVAELDRLARAGERFGVVFLDPPYDAPAVDGTLRRLGAGDLTEPGAIVIAQHFTKRAPAAAVGALSAFRARRFGETTLTFFRSGGYDAPSPSATPDEAPDRED